MMSLPNCQRLRFNTYTLKVASATVPEALCRISHELDANSDAYCIRHHPHDETVEFSIKVSDLPALTSELEARLRSVHITPGVDEQACSVSCPSFLTANIIRRALWTTVAVVACSSVRIHVNTSSFTDSMIAHRCGQLAIQGNNPQTCAHLDVTDRDVLAKDIIFASVDLAVAECDKNAIIVKLRAGQRYQADLYFQLGTPLFHAKFHCVASPSYHADVRLQREPSAEEMSVLSENGYEVDKTLLCHRQNSTPCRSETIRELAPTLGVQLGPSVNILVESLGQMPVLKCVSAAIDAVLQENLALNSLLTECEKTGVYVDYAERPK